MQSYTVIIQLSTFQTCTRVTGHRVQSKQKPDGPGPVLKYNEQAEVTCPKSSQGFSGSTGSMNSCHCPAAAFVPGLRGRLRNRRLLTTAGHLWLLDICTVSRWLYTCRLYMHVNVNLCFSSFTAPCKPSEVFPKTWSSIYRHACCTTSQGCQDAPQCHELLSC